MPPTRVAERALRVATTSSRQYICKSCRAQAHAARQFSSSTRVAAAEEPFYRRLQRQIFGNKEQEADQKLREQKAIERQEEALGRGGGVDVDSEPRKVRKNGVDYEVAAYVDPQVNKDYVPASSADGLEIIGSDEWVRQREDHGEVYVGFTPKRRVELDRRQWQSLLHHITVEALVLQKAKRPTGQVCYPRLADSNGWMHTRNATIKPSATGKGITVTFPDPNAELQILASIPKELMEGAQGLQDEDALFTEVEGAIAQSGDRNITGQKPKGRLPPAWMDVSVSNPGLKIAIVKRALQLTGSRLPDPLVGSATTLADLYQGYITEEPAKKLYDSKEIQRLKANVPNVIVHEKRQTMMEKEKAIGRWKLIEEELVARDLPLTGLRWPRTAKSDYR